MSLSRRRVLVGALAAPAVIAQARLGSAAPAKVLKISHQFPGGTIDQGDFRDRLCRKFAAGLEAKTNGALGAQVYPNSSLMKTVAQFSALRKGALDLSLYPISYAGGEFAELNIGLMPGLVSSYKQGAAWKSVADRPEIHCLSGRERRHHRCLDLAGRRRGQPVGGNSQSGRLQGPENPWRQPRDGHGAAGGRRDHAVDSVERTLRGHADRRVRRGHHVLDQPDLVPPRRNRQEPDDAAAASPIGTCSSR